MTIGKNEKTPPLLAGGGWGEGEPPQSPLSLTPIRKRRGRIVP